MTWLGRAGCAMERCEESAERVNPGSSSMFIAKFIEVYSYIVLASVLISWVGLARDHPVVEILDTFTEPLLKPIRELMPDTGGIDFSPIVLIFLLNFLAGMFV